MRGIGPEKHAAQRLPQRVAGSAVTRDDPQAIACTLDDRREPHALRLRLRLAVDLVRAVVASVQVEDDGLDHREHAPDVVLVLAGLAEGAEHPEVVHRRMDAVERAAERARADEGPTLLEFRTYRYKGHSMSDPQKYRSKEEVEEYKHRDPIEQVRQTILEKKIATEKDLEAIEQKVNAQVEESVKFAEESQFPDPSEALKDIYFEPGYPFIMD